MAVEQPARATPYKSILSGVRAGILLIALGTALLILHELDKSGPQANNFIGTIALTLGIGFEVAAAATYFLSRSFGLLNRDERA